MSRDSTRQLSPNFKVREFACKGSDVVLLDDELVVLLQCIREHFGKPVYITSGYRTAAHNAAVDGSKSSQHLLGRAADFYVEGVDVATVAAYAETLLPSRGGIGRYPKDANHPTRKTESSIGKQTLARQFRCISRLKRWKIIVISRRAARSCAGVIVSRRCPFTMTSPSVGRSSILIQRTSVDLPAPLMPMMP